MVLMCLVGASTMWSQSTRPERRLITEGNKLYVGRKFKEAATVYENALRENAESAVARYNLGLAQIRQVANPKDTTPATLSLLEKGRKNLLDVASLAKTKPSLAAKANYNLGNLEFNTEKYQEAINYYKQALRIDPQDNQARKNLRIAQLKQQNQNNQDKNQQNQQQQNQQQNQDQNKDQQDKQDQNKDQNQNKQDKQNQDNKEQPNPKEINPQTASQILQAMDNKENQTRARVNRANNGGKVQGGGQRSKRW